MPSSFVSITICLVQESSLFTALVLPQLHVVQETLLLSEELYSLAALADKAIRIQKF